MERFFRIQRSSNEERFECEEIIILEECLNN
jgi:hypothetical protein